MQVNLKKSTGDFMGLLSLLGPEHRTPVAKARPLWVTAAGPRATGGHSWEPEEQIHSRPPKKFQENMN